MKKLVFVAAIALSVLGCKKKEEAKATGGSATSGAPGAVASSADCDKALAHSMELSKPEMQKMGLDDATMAKMVELGTQHCKDDKWSADAVKCMLDAKEMKESQTCYDKLTPDQQDKMNKAAQSLAKDPAPGSADTAAPAGSGSGSAGSAAGSGSGS